MSAGPKSLRELAHHMPCMINIYGHCTSPKIDAMFEFNPEPRPELWEGNHLAHLRGDTILPGVANKSHDLFGAWSCKACHDIVDGRNKNHDLTQEELTALHYSGFLKTLQWLIKMHVVLVALNGQFIDGQGKKLF